MSVGRYARHDLIDWFSQQELAESRVAVVGAGAIGNEVVKNLALLGTGAVDLYDFDTVELHNLTRSVLLREEDVGLPKAQAVARRAAQLDPNCRVRAIDGDIRDTMTPASVAGYRAVIAAVDNFEARLRLNQLCLLAGVDLVNCAIDSRFVSVETYPHAHWDVACYECHLPESAYQRIAQRYSCGGLRKVAFAEKKVATTAITASIAGAMASAAALHLGERAARDATAKSAAMATAAAAAAMATAPAQRVFCDTHTMVSQRSMLARQPGCAACSGLARRPEPVTVGRDWRGLFAEQRGNEDALVLLAEPVIVACACTQCGRDALRAAPELAGRRAADYDDGLGWCPNCARPSMAVEIRDRLSAGELLALYPDAPPPLPYVLLDDGARRRCVTWQSDPTATPRSP